ncbi:MAG: hypothetical protein HY820_11730 [Acidobacteria bacterium]|nr:hypothetical protein [Acidobacteriota bacterium]
MNFPNTTKPIAAFCFLTLSGLTHAQITSGTKLEIVVANQVAYFHDAVPYGEYATLQRQTTPTTGGRNFRSWTSIGDVVSVNGKPAKGVSTFWTTFIGLATNPANGQAISDVNGRFAQSIGTLEILQEDGTSVGSLMLQGTIGGLVVPGRPIGGVGANFAIVGGTGAFLGARGFSGQVLTSAVPLVGAASVSEDPGIRRSRPGDEWTLRMTLVPLHAPEVITTPSGPAVVHSSDLTPVTPAKPARPGEVVSLFARHLGPTTSTAEPGQPFPEMPLQPVNSPLEILVNGTPAEILAATGHPGSIDGYQVNFRMPPDTASGNTTVRLSVAWMAAPDIRIPVE